MQLEDFAFELVDDLTSLGVSAICSIDILLWQNLYNQLTTATNHCNSGLMNV